MSPSAKSPKRPRITQGVRIGGLEEQCGQLKDVISGHGEELATIKDTNQTLSEEIKTLKDSLSAFQSMEEVRRQELGDTRQELEDAREMQQRLEKQLAHYQRQYEEHTRSYSAMKAVLQETWLTRNAQREVVSNIEPSRLPRSPQTKASGGFRDLYSESDLLHQPSGVEGIGAMDQFLCFPASPDKDMTSIPSPSIPSPPHVNPERLSSCHSNSQAVGTQPYFPESM